MNTTRELFDLTEKEMEIYKSLLNFKLLAPRNAHEVGSFVLFKLTYDSAVFFSVIGSFFNEHKAK